jgi:hypothetical protein
MRDYAGANREGAVSAQGNLRRRADQCLANGGVSRSRFSRAYALCGVSCVRHEPRILRDRWRRLVHGAPRRGRVLRRRPPVAHRNPGIACGVLSVPVAAGATGIRSANLRSRRRAARHAHALDFIPFLLVFVMLALREGRAHRLFIWLASYSIAFSFYELIVLTKFSV